MFVHPPFLSIGMFNIPTMLAFVSNQPHRILLCTQFRGIFVHPPQLMRETIGRPPHWFVRYGTALVALALLALGAVGYCFYTIP